MYQLLLRDLILIIYRKYPLFEYFSTIVDFGNHVAKITLRDAECTCADPPATTKERINVEEIKPPFDGFNVIRDESEKFQLGVTYPGGCSESNELCQFGAHFCKVLR